MDTKANLSNRKKINELAVQHNKLTTLVACLLNEVGALKKELQDVRGGGVDAHRNVTKISTNDNSQSNNYNTRQTNPNKFSNFNELRAEDILKQLSINSSDN